VKSGLLLNVVVRKGAAILELLSGKDETLLIGRNSLLVLNLGLDVVDGIGRLYIEGNGLSGKSLDKNLHTTTKTKNKVKSGLLLNVVVRKGTTILELLSGKDETLLIGRNSLLVLNLGLDVVNGIGRLYIESNGLSGKSLDKNLRNPRGKRFALVDRLLKCCLRMRRKERTLALPWRSRTRTVIVHHSDESEEAVKAHLFFCRN
jgi:hypothetical protein